jgi:uncharacterized protein YbaP (TraB family)
MWLTRSLGSRARRWSQSLPGLAAALLLALTPVAAAQTLPIWEIGKGGRTGYLVATLHVGLAEFYPLPPPMRQAFEWSENIAVELDGSRVDNQKAVATAGSYPEGSDLEKTLGAADWQKLRPLLDRYGITPDEARRMKPWLLASTLTVLAQSEAGYLPELGVDGALSRVAASSGKRVVELERFPEQARVLDEMSDKHGREWLLRTVNAVESGKAKENIVQTVDAWRAGDLQQMQKLMEAEIAGNAAAAEISRRVVESRAGAIAARIEALLAEGGRTVFAVHFANLAGADGVMARLARAGFRMRQLTVDSRIEPAAAPPGTAK